MLTDPSPVTRMGSRKHMANPTEEPGPELSPSTPRWVKVFGIIIVIGVLLFVGLLLFGGGHGPRRHTSYPATSARTIYL